MKAWVESRLKFTSPMLVELCTLYSVSTCRLLLHGNVTGDERS